MDKIDRLLDAIEHPDCYSETYIETLLADPEVREVYDMLNKTKASLTPIATPDIDTEWEEFERHHRMRRSGIINLFSRNIAASLVIGMASIAAVAAVVGVGVSYVLEKKDVAPVSNTTVYAKNDVTPTDTIVVDGQSVTTPEIIVFDNEPFAEIIRQIAEYYGDNVEFSKDTAKSLRLYFRWNQAQTLDEVVESLNNFEQIHITVKDKTIKID